METMMSFPALETSMTLMSGMGGTPLTVTGVTVEASDDDGSSWKTGSTDGTSGIWSFSGLSLNSGENTIRVKLTVTSTVNTEVKTTDGQTAVADTNDFATFTVTLP
jgi:hypothetical protein